MSTPSRGRDGQSDLPVRRIDRILAFTSLGLLVFSLLCFVAIIVGTVMHAQFNTGVWPAIGIIVYIAPVLAFLLLMVLVISSFVRRARANRDR